MSTHGKATTAELLALPFYAVMDLFLDLPWVPIALGSAAAAAVLLVLA